VNPAGETLTGLKPVRRSLSARMAPSTSTYRTRFCVVFEIYTNFPDVWCVGIYRISNMDSNN